MKNKELTVTYEGTTLVKDEKQEIMDNLFKPGQSGNPAGRPKGARQKFATAFVEAFAKDFERFGPAVIELVRTQDPSTYLRTACTILPKVIELDDDTKDALKDLSNAIPFDAIRLRTAQSESDKPKTTH